MGLIKYYLPLSYHTRSILGLWGHIEVHEVKLKVMRNFSHNSTNKGLSSPMLLWGTFSTVGLIMDYFNLCYCIRSNGGSRGQAQGHELKLKVMRSYSRLWGHHTYFIVFSATYARQPIWIWVWLAAQLVALSNCLFGLAHTHILHTLASSDWTHADADW